MEKKQTDKKEKQTPQAEEEIAAVQPEETSKAEKEADEEEPKDETQVKLDQAQEELKKQKELLLRTAAEYDNYRKRTEREKAAVYADATSAAVVEFLAVADNLERALEQKDCSIEDLRKGVEMVSTQLKGALTKLGVTEMGETGEAFNPDLHNAVSHMDDENAGENTIAQVFQKGYKIGDKVVRHAMVQVAN
nr:nucleotide exchange factor GrpE [uncultured Caproiciproducens sp.]